MTLALDLSGIQWSPQQRAVFAEVEHGEGHLIVDALAGTGKCLGRGTPVLRFDGSVVPVESIVAGDVLMGPDSKPRRVLATNVGTGPLYRITPTRGDSWVCNDVHVMTLVGTNFKAGQIIDIPLDVLIAQHAGKHRIDRDWKLFRVPVEFPRVDLPVDPYLVGLWLGDGSRGEATITNCEPEVRAYCRNIAPKYGAECVETRDDRNSTWTIRFRVGARGEAGSHKPSFLRRFFASLGDTGEKVIPRGYLMNDRASRAELLAGIIDTDGYLTSGCWDVALSDGVLASQVAFLARSLGLFVSTSAKSVRVASGETIVYRRLSISGDLASIPCRVPRRIAGPRKQVKDPLRTGFTAEPIGTGEYFGFTLDGDGRFLLGDFTVTHNTTTVIEALKRLPHGSRALLCAFNKSIADELEARAPRGVKVQTLHGLGCGILYRAWGKCPLDARRPYRHLSMAVSEWREGRERAPMLAPSIERELAAVLSLCKSRLVDSTEAIEHELQRAAIALPQGVSFADAAWIVARALDLAIKQDGTICFDDMVYVPARLGLRGAQYDVVFVDETQDMSRAQLVLAQAALKPGGRLVLVGDRNQCHPPGTMIATSEGDVPVEDLISRQRSKGLTLASWNRNAQKMINGRSFAAATRFYEGVMHKVQIGDRSVSMTSNHKVLARWSNRDAQTCVVYLMYRRGLGYRVGWCKLFSTTEGHKNFHLGIRTRIEKADAVWILKAFDDRTEASAYESIVAARFGLPTLPFEPVHGANHITRASIDDVFSQLKEENGARGKSCLRDHGRDPSFPLYPFADSDDGARSRGTVFKTYASNVLPDLMCLPLPDGQNTWGKVDAVHNSLYAGPVFSLNVEKDHSYSANGIVVLNCIYGWRGADVGSMDRMATELDATVLPLSVTRRCPRSVVALARRVVPAFEAAPDAPEGIVSTCDLGRVEWTEGDLVVSRLNAPLARCALAAIRQGKRARIQGKEFAQIFRSWAGSFGARRVADLLQVARAWVQTELTKLGSDEQDVAEDLLDRVATLEALAEGCATVEQLFVRLDSLFSDEGPGLLFSSTHRAKGMERDRVFVLAWTFKPDAGGEAANLWYVAITRAKRELTLVTGPRAISDRIVLEAVGGAR